MDAKTQLDREVEWHRLEQAVEEFTGRLLSLNLKNIYALTVPLKVYVEVTRRMIREGTDPHLVKPTARSQELSRLGHALGQIWSEALLDAPENRRAFFIGLFGEVARISFRWLAPRREPGSPPLTGVVESSAIAAHPTKSLRATDHLAPPGEPAGVTRQRRNARSH